MKIIIATPSLAEFDAVSNDVLGQRKYLIEAHYQVEVFSEFVQDSIRPLIATKEHVIPCILEHDNLLIYHHSVYWELGEKIFKLANCSILMKYHNISPSKFYKNYDQSIYNVTKLGAEQTAKLITSGKIKWFVGDSQYNKKELIALGAHKKYCTVIPPFNTLQEFEKISTIPKIKIMLKEFNFVNILFVGRIVPNKGHIHLIKTLSRYIYNYGTNVRLHLVGDVNPKLSKYYQLLENDIKKYCLSNLVKFHRKVDLKTLYTFYKYSTVFLILSEHEGFCVPITEAQYFHLPIIAWNQCAVGETLGNGQLLFEKCNYDTFAIAIHRLTTDIKLKNKLIQNGLDNLKQFDNSETIKKTLMLIDS